MNKKWILGVVLAVAAVAPQAWAQCGCCGYPQRVWRGGDRGPGYGQWQRGGPAVRLYDPAKVTTLQGIITAVNVTPVRPGSAGGLHVTVQAGQKTTEVRMGPAWFVQAEGLTFTKGETVEVTGSLMTRGERTFLIAREVKKGEKTFQLREADGTPMWWRRGKV